VVNLDVGHWDKLSRCEGEHERFLAGFHQGKSRLAIAIRLSNIGNDFRAHQNFASAAIFDNCLRAVD
jgi:hypothetical protein